MLGHEICGRESLRRFIESDQPAGRRGLHLTTGTIIALSEGRAEICSNFLFLAAGDTAGVVVTAGRYRDMLEPCEGEWLFADREATLVFPVASQRWGQ
jgi:hypothetical protein